MKGEPFDSGRSHRWFADDYKRFKYFHHLDVFCEEFQFILSSLLTAPRAGGWNRWSITQQFCASDKVGVYCLGRRRQWILVAQTLSAFIFNFSCFLLNAFEQ